MAAAVKLHAAGGNLLHVKIGVNNGFFVPDGFACFVAEGVDDAAAAAAGNNGKTGNLIGAALRFRIVRFAENEVGIYKVAVAFNCNMANRVLPLGVVVRVRRNVDRNAFS